MAPGTRMREPNRLACSFLQDGYLTQLCYSKKGSVGVMAVSPLLCCRRLLYRRGSATDVVGDEVTTSDRSTSPARLIWRRSLGRGHNAGNVGGRGRQGTLIRLLENLAGIASALLTVMLDSNKYSI